MELWTVIFSVLLEEVIVWNFVSGQSLLKPSLLSNITKILVGFKPELNTI